MLETTPLISIILPVYNRIEFVSQAIESVLGQSYNNWELIVADDASKPNVHSFLKEYNDHERICVHFNKENLGLFPNLNRAIESSKGSYILLLCSDDKLLPECLESSLRTLKQYPEAGLLLSAFRTIVETGEEVESGSIYYYRQFLDQSVVLSSPLESLSLLLQHGSINGNLTGMFFERKLYEKIGQFEENSFQVSDWEWVYRVARKTPIVLSQNPVAMVRRHEKQLSNKNFKNLNNSLEVSAMIRLLLRDPLTADIPSAQKWATHIMHYHLWFAFKFFLKGDALSTLTLIQSVHKTTGLLQTAIALLRWLPQRWQVYRNNTFAMPPAK